MTCRLYVDEIGNDDMNTPGERYLSLTGIITKQVYHVERITPTIERLKADLFDHDPQTNPVILHRKELVRREPPFDALWDPETKAEFDRRVIMAIDRLPYLAMTAAIDKLALKERYQVWHYNPYHYCLRALVERFVLWMRRHNETGSVWIEARYKKVDKKLKTAFTHIYDHGTEHISQSVIQKHLTSRELNLALKSENVCGLQLVDLIAHPSHHGTKARYTDDAMKAPFGLKIMDILERKKYCREPKSMTIDGWGQKWLP